MPAHPFRTQVFALLLLAACTLSAQTAQEHPLPVNPPTSTDTLIPAAQRKLAPDFALTDSNGQLFSLAQQKGHVVVLNFWATWCGGCKFELPYFVAYDNAYKARGLVTLGISMDDTGFSTVKPFWTAHAMPYPTVIGNDALANKLGLTGMPFTLVLDKSGRIALTHAGVVDRADFERHLKQLLAANP